MHKPKAKPKYIRWLLYYWQAKNLIGFIKNWYLIPLSYLGLISPKNGLTLYLNNGLQFTAKHFLEAVGIKEVFVDSDYHLPAYKSKAVVIDIGANIGAFSIYAALSSPQVSVYCVEPSRSTFRTLSTNIKINHLDHRIVPINAAVWGSHTKIKLFSAGPSGIRSAFRSRGETRYESIDTVTLEDIFNRYKLKKCDFLKIDCEGAEYEILKTCQPKTFSKIKQISLEFHELTPDQRHQELIRILKKNGFRVKSQYHSIENNIGYIYAIR